MASLSRSEMAATNPLDVKKQCLYFSLKTVHACGIWSLSICSQMAALPLTKGIYSVPQFSHL